MTIIPVRLHDHPKHILHDDDSCEILCSITACKRSSKNYSDDIACWLSTLRGLRAADDNPIWQECGSHLTIDHWFWFTADEIVERPCPVRNIRKEEKRRVG